MQWPTCPPSLKQIQHFLKIAQEHDERDIVVAYWARVYALQVGLKVCTHQPDEMALLLAVMDWLETKKKEQVENDAITNEVASQAHLENYALKLFLYADQQDRNENWNKNVVKAFYSSAVVYDILQTFGELTEEVLHNRKYAKWKASYIHNCLKNGVTPIPGPMQQSDDNENENFFNEAPPTVPFDSATDNLQPENEPEPEEPAQPFQPVQPIQPVLPPEPQTPVQDIAAPSGFVINPVPTPVTPIPPQTPTAGVAAKVSADQIMKAQKYCKYAGSALNYDDVKTAIENLQKALTLLTTGQE